MKTEIICIIDKSGSMGSLVAESIAGFNKFLADQKAIGPANFSLILFDDRYEPIHLHEDIADIPPLTSLTYVPRGSTALNDAIGRTIDVAGIQFANAHVKPDKVIVAILTDGFENSSTDYKQSDIAFMIKHQTNTYGWEFVYLAANQDALAVASDYNIPKNHAVNIERGAQGMSSGYGTMSDTVTDLRTDKE